MTARASILAIGTELTSGQIINSNASWLSQRISDLGVEVVLHQCVADDRAMIRDALNTCAHVSEFVFVTGGLGPTTDDFTRDVVADWAQLPMVFDGEAWKRIEERLSHFGVPIAESNRQQCYFPRGARILANSAGTASGFTFAHGKSLIWVLPGPPPEIQAIWKDHQIENELQSLLPKDLKKLRLRTWDCLGKSEAELGEITEAALAESGLITGYRVHRPYVQVKVWIPEGTNADAHIRKLEAAIAPWLMTRDEEDLAASLLAKMRRADSIEIYDSCTGGLLGMRLSTLLRKPEYADLAERVAIATEYAPLETPPLSWVETTLEQADDETLTLAIGGLSAASGEWALGLREGSRTVAKSFTAPYRGTDLERPRGYAAEFALKVWRDELIEN